MSKKPIKQLLSENEQYFRKKAQEDEEKRRRAAKKMLGEGKEISDGEETLEQEYARLKRIEEIMEVEPHGLMEVIDDNHKHIIGINFYDMGLYKIPEEIRGFKNLDRIILPKNKLTSLPFWIKDIKPLKLLSAGRNKLNSIEEVSGLKELIFLDVYHNHLESLPNLSRLRELNRLNAHHNNLHSIPKNIGNLEYLYEIRLHCNNLKDLPESMLNMKNLQLVSIYDNPIPKNHPILRKLKEKGVIVLSEESDAVPLCLGNMAYANQYFIGNSQSDQTIFMINAKEYDVLEEIFEQHWESPRRLVEYSNNRIRTENNSLIRLSLVDYEFLRYLPESIGLLKNLKELYLYNTPLRQLPDSIGSLKNLEKFQIFMTQLTKLPDSIGNCNNLEHIDISWNEINNIPKSLTKLKKLKEIVMFNGPDREEKLKQDPITKYMMNQGIKVVFHSKE